MARKKKGEQSHYAAKGPPPQYSAHLRTWERAKKEGNDKLAEEAAYAHAKQFGYRRNRNALRDN